MPRFRPATWLASMHLRHVRHIDRASLALGTLVVIACFLREHAVLVPVAMPSFEALQASRPSDPPAGFGWWSGWDQSWYLQAALAWARWDLDPGSHWYPPGYPVLGALFSRLTPADPFMLPDLFCMVGALWVVAAIAAQLGVGRTAGVWLFVGSSALNEAVLRAWVVPWTTTPEAALLLLCVLGAVRFMSGLRPGDAALAGLAAGATLAFRPADAAGVGGVCAAAMAIHLLRRWPGTQRAAAVVAAGAASAMVPAALFGLAHLALNGWQPDRYVKMSATVGFEWRLLPLRWVLIMVDPRPLFMTGIGLAQVFWWIVPGVAGIAACLLAHAGRDRRFATAIVAAAMMLDVAMFLCYRDLHPHYLWDNGVYHYFKWTLPLFAVFAALLVPSVLVSRSVLSGLGKASAAALALAALFMWRVAITGAVQLGANRDAQTVLLPRGLSDLHDVLLLHIAPFQTDPAAFGSQIRTANGAYYNNFDFKLTSWSQNAMVQPLRPMQPVPSRLTLPASRYDLVGPAVLARQTLQWGVPCWFWPERPACLPTLTFPPPDLPLDRDIRFGRDTGGAIYFLGGLSMNEPVGSWSDGPLASLAFRVPTKARAQTLKLDLTAVGFEEPGTGPRRVAAYVNGHQVAQWRFGAALTAVEARIPAAAIGSDGYVLLDLVIANPRSPVLDLGAPDTRRLGIWLQTMRLEVAPAPGSASDVCSQSRRRLRSRRRPIHRQPPSLQRLRLIPRGWPTCRPLPRRRGRREPGLGGEHLRRPGLIGWVVGRDPPFAARPHRAGNQGHVIRMDEPALGVAHLGPGVGEHQEQAAERAGRQLPQQDAGVLVPDQQVRGDRRGCLAPLWDQGREQRTDAVLVYLAGDQARVRVGRRQRAGVFAAAEAHLQPQLGRALREGGERVGGLRRAQPQAGQRGLQQQVLAGAERVALGPAVEALRGRLQRPNALFSAGTRSVFSQVNVPSSGSGSRPKWP